MVKKSEKYFSALTRVVRCQMAEFKGQMNSEIKMVKEDLTFAHLSLIGYLNFEIWA